MYTRLSNPLKTHHFFLFGARGVGKSTYLNSDFSSPSTCLNFDLLDLDLEERYCKNPKLFIEEIASQAKDHIKYIIVDEIQKIPKLLDLIHQYIYKNKNKKIFVLTGSSAKKLKRGGGNLLAGRAFVYYLFPLTFLELEKDFVLDHYLQWGGLPEIYSFHGPADILNKLKNNFLKAYAHTYLKEEVWAEHFIKNLDPFRNFLELAALANGEIINYSKMARQIGVDSKTIQSYFQILEETLLAFIIEPFSTSIRKRLVKAPKFYFFDLGVKRALEHTLTVELKEGTYAYGKAFEHFIITQIIYLIHYSENDYRIYYLKTEAGVEIDLILQKPNKEILLVEIKSSTEIGHDDIKHLLEIRKDLKKSKAFLLSKDRISRTIDQVECYHWDEGIKALFT